MILSRSFGYQMTIDISAFGFGKNTAAGNSSGPESGSDLYNHAEHVRRGFSPRRIRMESNKTVTVEITL
jgi:hypothetical protein